MYTSAAKTTANAIAVTHHDGVRTPLLHQRGPRATPGTPRAVTVVIGN
jgi:hypothetical protein